MNETTVCGDRIKIFVDDINQMVHGDKIYLENSILEKYDTVTLKMLQLISIVINE